MSIEAIRRAFKAAAGGRLHLDHAGLGYQGRGQILSLTGWHADQLPFAMVTAPFDGNPIDRAAQAARDLVQAHSGSAVATGVSAVDGGPAIAPLQSFAGPSQIRSVEIMSQKGSGLARLMGGLRSLDTDADALASRLEAALGNLSTEMATTTQIVGNVESSVDDLKAVNALYSNGAAPPTSGGSSGSSQG